MSLFIRLSTQAMTDAKLIAAGPESAWLWVKGLLYAKEHLTDGYVPVAAIPLLAVGMKDAEACIRALLEAELWARCDGGYTVGVERWSRHQTTRGEVEEVREAARERQRVWRAKQKGGESRDAAAERQKPGREEEDLSRGCHAVTEAFDEVGEMPLTEPEHRAHSSEEVKALARPAPSVRALSDAEIERAYQAYPRHVGKGPALAAIRKAVLHLGTGVDWPKLNPPEALAFLCERARLFAVSPAGKNGRFTPHPATWFEQKRYLDDEREWNRDEGRDRRDAGIVAGAGNAGRTSAAAQRRTGSLNAIGRALERARGAHGSDAGSLSVG